MIYIYTLKDPLSNEVRYIGKTINLKERYKNHIKIKSNDYKSNWIKSLKIKGLKPIIEILDSTESDDWEWLEQYWISQFKSWGFRLTNMTSGGDSNYTFTDDIKRKMSIQRTGKKQSESCIELRISSVRRKVNQYDLNGVYIKTFNSIIDVSKEFKVSTTSIKQVLNGRSRLSKGFQFKYFKDNTDNILPIRKILKPNNKSKKIIYEYDMNLNFINCYDSFYDLKIKRGKVRLHQIVGNLKRSHKGFKYSYIKIN